MEEETAIYISSIMLCQYVRHCAPRDVIAYAPIRDRSIECRCSPGIVYMYNSPNLRLYLCFCFTEVRAEKKTDGKSFFKFQKRVAVR